MNADWTLVFSTNINYQADLVHQMLSNYGVESVIINKKDSSYNSFGELEIYVKENDKEVSVELLKDFKVE